MRTDAHSLGLLTAFLLGGAQVFWVALVGLGVAQPLVDFLMRVWFVAPALHIMPFAALHALALVFAMSVSGYLVGWAVGVALNSTQRSAE